MAESKFTTDVKNEPIVNPSLTASTITIYLIDDTEEQWVSNDNAVIELVDNTNGHDHYIMKKTADAEWSVELPKEARNITFNRLSPDKSSQWNSWSAGGRDSNNAYYVQGHEYGDWDVIENESEKETVCECTANGTEK